MILESPGGLILMTRILGSGEPFLGALEMPQQKKTQEKVSFEV